MTIDVSQRIIELGYKGDDSERLSQRLLAVAYRDMDMPIVISQHLLETAYRNTDRPAFVSQHCVEVAYTTGGRIYGPAAIHV